MDRCGHERMRSVRGECGKGVRSIHEIAVLEREHGCGNSVGRCWSRARVRRLAYPDTCETCLPKHQGYEQFFVTKIHYFSFFILFSCLLFFLFTFFFCWNPYPIFLHIHIHILFTACTPLHICSLVFSRRAHLIILSCTHRWLKNLERKASHLRII